MKTLILMSLLFSGQSMAAITGVGITHFRPIGDYPRSTAAEICGYVTAEKEKLIQVVITVDPRQSATRYSTMTDPQGNFCHVVSSRTGEASVGAFSQISGATSKTLQVQMHQ